MIKAVVFDLDGTLLNTLEDLTSACNHAIRKFGYGEISVQDTRTYIGNGIRNYILRSVGMDETHIDEMFAAFKEYYVLHCDDKTFPYPGICELVTKLKKEGYHLGCVSNKAMYALTTLCENHFKGMFEVVLGDQAGYKRKPDPEVIRAAAEKMGVSMDEFCYIGDSDVDVKTVGNSHCKGVFVSYGYRDKEVLLGLGADPVVDSAEDIYNRIKEMK